MVVQVAKKPEVRSSAHRQLGPRRDFKKDDGFAEDYTSVVRGEPIGSVVLVRFGDAGQPNQIAANNRPVHSVLLWSQLMGEHVACTSYAQYFLSRVHHRP